MTSRIEQLKCGMARDAARIMRASFDARLPWLAGLHTAAEDEQFFRTRMFAECAVWGATEGEALIGVIAFRDGWIDQLYVLPEWQSLGIGTRLLAVAKGDASVLCLWTFQRNHPARRFYERHGFVAVEQTDGTRNEEKEPDIRYRWCTGRERT